MDMFIVQSHIIKTFIQFFQSKSYYAGSSDTIYKLDDANLRIPILNPTRRYILQTRCVCEFYEK